MNDATPTPQEWAEMSASALAEKNRAVVSEMMNQFKSMQKASEREHWRRVFAASAISVGESCEDAVSIADKMLDLLRID